MKSCAFLGHRNINAELYRDKLLKVLTDLIENKGVTQFYSGYRGQFDRYCSNTVNDIKTYYPHIQNIMVLSYMPDKQFSLPDCFDNSVYFLDRKVPARFAIIETNKCLVDNVDCIVAGVLLHGGGAYSALQYAHKRKKPIISLIDGWRVI